MRYGSVPTVAVSPVGLDQLILTCAYWSTRWLDAATALRTMFADSGRSAASREWLYRVMIPSCEIGMASQLHPVAWNDTSRLMRGPCCCVPVDSLELARLHLTCPATDLDSRSAST
jgi:hypothetical protein